MQEALSFQRKSPCVRIIDDITRLARGLEAHIKLRANISGAGGIFESLSIEFGKGSDWILVKNLLASVSQHQRQKNGEQTKTERGYASRMDTGLFRHQSATAMSDQTAGTARFWCVMSPIPRSSKRHLKCYASGRFQTQAEVKRFLERQPAFPKDLNGREVRNQHVYEMLTRTLYAGYVEHTDWGVTIRKGQHEGLIDFLTFQKVQDRLNASEKAPERKDTLARFYPVR